MASTEELYKGPGFDDLRSYLDGIDTESPQVAAVLDIAEKFGIGARMFAGGGIAGRLVADRHNFPGSNFSSRTGAMFAEENADRRRANAVTDRILERRDSDSDYALTIDFLTTNVVRSINRASAASNAAKCDLMSRGFRSIVAEVCTEPYQGRHREADAQE